MIPKPQTKAQDLLNKLTALAVVGRAGINEMQMAALRRDAKESLKSDAFHGYMALGALASISWDDDGINYNHQRAIELSDTELAHRNYSVSLSGVLLYRDAAKEMLIASNKEPGNLFLLRRAIHFHIVAGLIGDAMELYQKLISRVEVVNNDDLIASRIAKILDMTGIDESELRQGQNIVLETLRRHHIFPDRITTDIDEDAVDPSVWMNFVIDTSSEEAQTIYDEVCARLCEELPDGGHPSVLMFGIMGNC